MSDTMVSVRMPVSLINELRELAEKNHFMDLSDEIRYIIRKKMQEQKDPFLAELHKLRKDIHEQVTEKSAQDRTRFIQEMRRMLDELQE